MRVIKWAEERNLIEGSTVSAQSLKLMEELGELFEGLAKGRPDQIKDSIGDVDVVLQILQEQILRDTPKGEVYPELGKLALALGTLVYTIHNPLESVVDIEENMVVAMAKIEDVSEELSFDFEECQDRAWDDIKDRKGKMINGIFVKEADL